MPKIKLPRKSPRLDMTPMVDLAFLLVTFFMLTTKFKADEPVVVDTPPSISNLDAPDDSFIVVTVSPKGQVFLNTDNKKRRLELISAIDEAKGLKLTDKEKNAFAVISTFGVPFDKLKWFLGLEPEQRSKYVQPGIPTDTTNNPSNELSTWVHTARQHFIEDKLVVKGDRESDYEAFHKVVKTFTNNNAHRFNLVTNMKRDE